MNTLRYERTRRGFRAEPYRYELYATGMYAFGSGGLGAELGASTVLPGTRFRLDAMARGVQFHGFRFYGLGNETPLPADHARRTLVEQDHVEARLAGVWEKGDLEIGDGPILRWNDPRLPKGSVLTDGQSLGRVGGMLRSAYGEAPDEVGEPAFRASLELTGFPQAWDVRDAFGALEGETAAYVPIPVGHPRPTLALRVGGRHLLGDAFPVQEAAFIGGRESVRGYRFNRFAGESAAWGGAELRVPLFELELLTRGRFGVLGFEDVGRVWLDGEDSSAWHDAWGAGVWYESLGFSVSGMYAHGEEDRYYVSFGMPF